MATRADEAGAAAAQEAALEFDQSHKHHVGPRYVRGGKDALGRPEGEGTMVWAGETCGKMAGQRYDGCFVAGLFEGAGTLCSCDALAMRDGRRYEGEWRAGRRDGEGVAEWDDGRYYHGGWREDARHGRGLFRWGKLRYEGEWARGKMHGGGEQRFADGSRYEGQYVEGKRHGRGRFTFPDGSYYTGGFQGDQFHGADGAFFHRSGEPMERPPLPARAYEYEGARDEKEQPHRHGDCTYADGTRYAGQWRNGVREGHGRLGWPESFGTDGGRYYEGGWRADLKHGRGLYVARDGTRFEGEWFEGNKCGEGTYTYPNGKKFAVDCGPRRPKE